MPPELDSGMDADLPPENAITQREIEQTPIPSERIQS
jgi:hypothetical protein